MCSPARCWRRIPAGRVVSVERDTFPGLLAAGAKVAGHVDSSYWLDLGTPNAFVQGSTDLVQGAAPTFALPGPPGPHLALPGAQVGASRSCCPAAPPSVAARQVGDRAHVVSSVVFDEAQIGVGADRGPVDHRCGRGDRCRGDRGGRRHRRPCDDRCTLRAAARRAGVARRRAAGGRCALQRRRLNAACPARVPAAHPFRRRVSADRRRPCAATISPKSTVGSQPELASCPAGVTGQLDRIDRPDEGRIDGDVLSPSRRCRRVEKAASTNSRTECDSPVATT